MIFLYSHWLRLPIATRHALARAFNIQKKNPTHVVDDVVRDDGYVLGDIESALTATAMSAYTGLPYSDAEQLWNDVVAKAEGRVVAAAPMPEPTVTEKAEAAEKAEAVSAPKKPTEIFVPEKLVKSVKKIIKKK